MHYILEKKMLEKAKNPHNAHKKEQKYILREFDEFKKVSRVSIVLLTLIHGFLGNKQYSSMALRMSTIKFSKHLYLEYST